eukprot:scaffold2192_cov170-Amphora_coffeaeformis.AAC.6
MIAAAAAAAASGMMCTFRWYLSMSIMRRRSQTRLVVDPTRRVSGFGESHFCFCCPIIVRCHCVSWSLSRTASLVVDMIRTVVVVEVLPCIHVTFAGGSLIVPSKIHFCVCRGHA